MHFMGRIAGFLLKLSFCPAPATRAGQNPQAWEHPTAKILPWQILSNAVNIISESSDCLYRRVPRGGAHSRTAGWSSWMENTRSESVEIRNRI